MQITASRVHLLLACQRPFDPAVELDEDDSPSEASRYGSCFHAVMFEMYFGAASWSAEVPRLMKEWGLSVTASTIEGLVLHAQRTARALEEWMKPAGNPFGCQWRIVDGEKHLAMTVKEVPIIEEVGFDPETHTYAMPADADGDLCVFGTYDLLLVNEAGNRCVLDYKTGVWADVSDVAGNRQMQTLAVMTSSLYVAILHTPYDLPPVVYADYSYTLDIRKRIDEADDRIGDGSMTPGKHCRYCPAKLSCPTQGAEVLKRAQGSLALVTTLKPDLATTEDLGKWHQFLADYDRLAKLARDRIRAAVADGAVVERPDGKTLRLEKRQVERLSKKAFVEALGAVEAEKRLEALRAEGILQTVEEEQLWARK